MSNEDRPRVIVALTETTPIDTLWSVVSQRIQNPDTELVTVFIADDRWRRAASLPFTREIPRMGGTSAKFSMQRAEQIHKAAIQQVHERMKQLAASAHRQLSFKVLTEPNEQGVREVVGERVSMIVAPALISNMPIYLHFSQFNCHIELVDGDDASRD
jgi:hypothetical protein